MAEDDFTKMTLSKDEQELIYVFRELKLARMKLQECFKRIYNFAPMAPIEQEDDISAR